MPSPPMMATLVMLDRLFMSVPCEMDPRPLRAIGGLEGLDFMLSPQRELDFVEAFQQSGTPARIDLEMVPLAGWRGDGLLFQIDADAPRALRGLDIGGKAIDDRR